MTKYLIPILLLLRKIILGFTPLVLLLLLLLPTCNSWSFKTWSKKDSEQNALSVDKKQRIVFLSSTTTTTTTVRTPSILSTSSSDGEFKDQSNICILYI